MTEDRRPDIQLLANVVLHSNGKVALTKYDADDERWWLPGAELNAYEHPDEALARAIADLKINNKPDAHLHHVESFRGRRGWHVMFNYSLALDEQQALPDDYQWFDAKQLPAMMHGAWEKAVIEKSLHS